MEVAGWEITRLELKYCERCGGLWVRERGTEEVYCATCISEVSKFMFGGRRLGPRTVATIGHLKLAAGKVTGVACCGEEGHA
jgi:hypothetical protein